MLQADEPTDDPSMIDDALHMSTTFEEGFKGKFNILNFTSLMFDPRYFHKF